MFSIDRPQNQFYEEPERLVSHFSKFLPLLLFTSSEKFLHMINADSKKWIHDSCVLLDGDNNPVRPWAEIPRCFSSKIEGKNSS